jgi:hypothetical protein
VAHRLLSKKNGAVYIPIKIFTYKFTFNFRHLKYQEKLITVTNLSVRRCVVTWTTQFCNSLMTVAVVVEDRRISFLLCCEKHAFDITLSKDVRLTEVPRTVNHSASSGYYLNHIPVKITQYCDLRIDLSWGCLF